MDSATLLASAIDVIGRKDIETITFNYGSKHNAKENACAKLMAAHFGVSNELVELPFVGQLFKSDLLKTGGAVPEGHYAADNMKKTVVPFRNGIMLAIAAGFAESRECKQIMIGNHAGDHDIYPDCRADFTDAMMAAIAYGTWARLQLLSPFVTWSKADIVAHGVKLGVPYQLTWSCYKGEEVPCGKCGTCVERLEAFHLAQATDPLSYADREYYKTVTQGSKRP